MRKANAVAALGPHRLSLPAWVKAALAANDRLKLYLTLVQAGVAHAEHPQRELPDLQREFEAAGVRDAWLRDLVGSTGSAGQACFIPDLERLAQRLGEDLALMARPVLETASSSDEDGQIGIRVQHWQSWLAGLRGDRLASDDLRALTHGSRQAGDSLHLLVMDLHKRINALAADLASEELDGAQVWQLAETDRELVRAFMRGLRRTAPLKFDHPGLDTAATRDGEKLLIQNDIGTNDVHVLVLQVGSAAITLTYSDLHRSRFAFFQGLLEEIGATWSVVEPQVSAGLNRGEAYWVGTATFESADEPALRAALERLGARIVFLIDWNRARKRLQAFVDKDGAIAVLADAARQEVGHMAWLKAGGERLVFDAMQSQGDATFRIGDRLDDVLGAEGARGYLLDVLAHSTRALLAGHPAALAADQARMLLSHYVQRRGGPLDLLSEHAGYCQALAQQVCDGLAHGAYRDAAEAGALAVRAKSWERRADHLVMQARERAARQPAWRRHAALLERSDDVADALEEAAFMLTLVADGHHQGWRGSVQPCLQRLADTVLQATQEHVKALAVATAMGGLSGLGGPGRPGDGGVAADHDDFLTASWNVLQAERRCDELLRHARREILREIDDAASLMLATDLAMTLELASDRLLEVGYALREIVLAGPGAGA